MNYLAEINKALVEKVRNGLIGTDYEGIKIDAQDISENIKPNTLKVFCEADYSQEMAQRVITVAVEIYYYAQETKKYKIDCVKMQDILQECLMNGIMLEDEKLYIDKIDFEINNKVLFGTFEIEKKVSTYEEDGEPMEELEVNYECNFTKN